jgi:hypothetical protein
MVGRGSKVLSDRVSELCFKDCRLTFQLLIHYPFYYEAAKNNNKHGSYTERPLALMSLRHGTSCVLLAI